MRQLRMPSLFLPEGSISNVANGTAQKLKAQRAYNECKQGRCCILGLATPHIGSLDGTEENRLFGASAHKQVRIE